MAKKMDEDRAKTLRRMRGRGATYQDCAEQMDMTRSAACSLGTRLSKVPPVVLQVSVDDDVAAFLDQLARRNRTSPQDEAAAMLAEIARDTVASDVA